MTTTRDHQHVSPQAPGAGKGPLDKESSSTLELSSPDLSVEEQDHPRAKRPRLEGGADTGMAQGSIIMFDQRRMGCDSPTAKKGNWGDGLEVSEDGGGNEMIDDVARYDDKAGEDTQMDKVQESTTGLPRQDVMHEPPPEEEAIKVRTNLYVGEI